MFGMSGITHRLLHQVQRGEPKLSARVSGLLAVVATVVTPVLPVEAQQDTVTVTLPTERCEEGTITSIDVVRGSVFDPDSTDIGVLAWTYRLMNVVHIRTQESFIRRELLFEEGECYDQFLATESERLLES